MLVFLEYRGMSIDGPYQRRRLREMCRSSPMCGRLTVNMPVFIAATRTVAFRDDIRRTVRPVERPVVDDCSAGGPSSISDGAWVSGWVASICLVESSCSVESVCSDETILSVIDLLSMVSSKKDKGAE